MQEFHTSHTNSYKACLCAPANTAGFADHAKELHPHQQQHSSPLCADHANITHTHQQPPLSLVC